jgi:hypothetical protein
VVVVEVPDSVVTDAVEVVVDDVAVPTGTEHADKVTAITSVASPAEGEERP